MPDADEFERRGARLGRAAIARWVASCERARICACTNASRASRSCLEGRGVAAALGQAVPAIAERVRAAASRGSRRSRERGPALAGPIEATSARCTRAPLSSSTTSVVSRRSAAASSRTTRPLCDGVVVLAHAQRLACAHRVLQPDRERGRVPVGLDVHRRSPACGGRGACWSAIVSSSNAVRMNVRTCSRTGRVLDLARARCDAAVRRPARCSWSRTWPGSRRSRRAARPSPVAGRRAGRPSARAPRRARRPTGAETASTASRTACRAARRRSAPAGGCISSARYSGIARSSRASTCRCTRPRRWYSATFTYAGADLALAAAPASCPARRASARGT